MYLATVSDMLTILVYFQDAFIFRTIKNLIK